MGRARLGLKFNIGKHGRLYIPLGGSKKKEAPGKAESAKPAVRSTTSADTSEPSVLMAVITGLMSLLLLVGLFFVIIAVGSFIRHRSAGEVFVGIICTGLGLAGLYFGGLGLGVFIQCVRELKEKKAGKAAKKEAAELAEKGLERSSQYSFFLEPDEEEHVQALLRRWKLYGGTIELKLRSNDETGAVSFDYLGEPIGQPNEPARAWITENFDKIQSIRSAVVIGGGHTDAGQPRPFTLDVTLDLTEPTVHPVRGLDPLPGVRYAFEFPGDRVCVLSKTGKIHTCPPICGIGDAGLTRYLLDDLDEEKYSLCLKCYRDYF